MDISASNALILLTIISLIVAPILSAFSAYYGAKFTLKFHEKSIVKLLSKAETHETRLDCLASWVDKAEGRRMNCRVEVEEKIMGEVKKIEHECIHDRRNLWREVSSSKSEANGHHVQLEGFDKRFDSLENQMEKMNGTMILILQKLGGV